MSALSDYLENKLIDHVFRAQAYTAPATLYVALFTVTPSDTGGGTECPGTGYTRQGVTSGLTTWAATQSVSPTPNNSASSGTGGTTFNSAIITFTSSAGASWGTINGVGVFDASSGGNLLWYSALTTPKTINTTDVVDFPVSTLTFQIDN